MKYFELFFSLIVILSSCENRFDVKSIHSDGTVCKFICENDKDTSNSVRYCYYKSLLISKTTFVDGKKEGSVIDYYPNGNIHIITNYRNNRAQGVNKVFNEQGELIRRSFYINDKQVLFESIMVNTDDPIKRKKIIILRDNRKAKWAGELYTNLDNEPVTVAGLNIGDYQGMYVEVKVDDTLKLGKEATVRLKITFPVTIPDPEILIGEFDRSLTCIDTSFYVKLDSLGKDYAFNYLPERPGNNYILGKLTVPDNLLKDPIYFFRGFYVKENPN